ncbi:hypothetical protein M3610_24500 [Neobacillus sp. MER 74]|uniref:hypothetical protein n=1 Tax=Neobacillus sp. MER 74 TaxID=2939566 RepID=UPI002040A69B|nr:hypothetical protein [Neobacillus sp. MER 74]MCM3118375.1 hypothetical protein [Neobacillus sp. MER 74]
MLKVNLISILLIGVEGTKTPAGYGAGETPQEQSDEEAPRHACGKRSAWNGNQHTSLKQPCV